MAGGSLFSIPIRDGTRRCEGCEVCGNDYDKTFEIIVARESRHHVFDSFECAIQALAPRCAHCGCRVIGHGVEGGGSIFCCASCAKRSGVGGVADRTPEDSAVR
ncbi:MAG: hypothetical protein ACRDJF_05260 [Actinomycetota bacterium]